VSKNDVEELFWDGYPVRAQVADAPRKKFRLFARQVEVNGHSDSIFPSWCAMMPVGFTRPWNGSLVPTRAGGTPAVLRACFPTETSTLAAPR